MFRFGSRSRKKLWEVHPDLVLVVSRGLLYSPVDFAITEGARSVERQHELYEKGFSKTLRSRHLLHPDGVAHAIDVMAVGDINGDGARDHKDKALTWEPDVYAQIAEAMHKAADELGISIRWGGDFRGFFDGPHFELVG